MDKPVILAHKGDKFQSCGLGKFTKDILIQGVYIHPDTGQTVDLSDPARLQRLAENTMKFRKAGNKVAFPDGHKFEAMANLGDWDDTFIVKDGRLWGMVNPRGKDVEEKLDTGKIDGVSAYIETNVKDGLGNLYPEVMTHICATDYAVIPGQGKFKRVAMSRTGEEVPIYLSKQITEGMSPEASESLSRKEGSMDPKKMAVALGLPETASAEDILGAVAKLTDSQKAALAKKTADEAAATALAAELKSKGFELVDGKVVALSTAPETPREKQMREQLETLQLDRAKDKLAAAKARAEALTKAGLVPPAIAAKLSKLFAIKDKVEALALSADGKSVTGEAIDLEATLNELLSGIKGIAGTRLSVFKPAEDDSKEKSADELRKEGAALARKVQGLPEKKETA